MGLNPNRQKARLRGEPKIIVQKEYVLHEVRFIPSSKVQTLMGAQPY